jgi:hypothetical protein
MDSSRNSKQDIVQHSIHKLLTSFLAATLLISGPVSAVTEGQTLQRVSEPSPTAAKAAASGDIALPNLGNMKIPNDLTTELEKFPGDISKQINSIKV